MSRQGKKQDEKVSNYSGTYTQQKPTPTGFCQKCGRIPSQCECKTKKQETENGTH